VNPRTVSQAYAELEREGVVRVQPGRGTFVSPEVRPDRRERPRLAREVARRALADATRNGLVLDELMTALRQVGDASESELDPDLDPAEETR
jgi:GntR family transcriptional regulator